MTSSLIVFHLLGVCSYFLFFFKELAVCSLLIAVEFTNKSLRFMFELEWVWDIFETRFEKKTDDWDVKSRFEKKNNGWGIEKN